MTLGRGAVFTETKLRWRHPLLQQLHRLIELGRQARAVEATQVVFLQAPGSRTQATIQHQVDDEVRQRLISYRRVDTHQW